MNNQKESDSDGLKSKRARFRTFLIAYAISPLVVLVIFGLVLAVADQDLSAFFFAVALYPLFIILLPLGLGGAVQWILTTIFRINIEFSIFAPTPMGPALAPTYTFGSFLLMGFSYLLFFVIPMIGIRTNSRRIYRNMLICFVIMLIINLAGCVAINFRG